MKHHALYGFALFALVLLIGCAASGETSDVQRRSPNIVYADEIQERHARTLADVLIGRVPGVYEEGGELRIRGANSFVTSNEPLYVLDGVPLNTPPTVEVRDIASVEVLKGSAASRYGARGSNGVIVIQTKTQ